MSTQEGLIAFVQLKNLTAYIQADLYVLYSTYY
jgi:hypothetical protein